MNFDTTPFKLKLITVVDSFCGGLVTFFLPAYLSKTLGANNVVLGISAAGNLICHLISYDVFQTLTRMGGYKYALFLMLNIAFCSHILMILTDSVWFTVFSRFAFSLTNRCGKVCKKIMITSSPKDELEYNLSSMKISSVIFSIIGQIVGGYLSYVNNGFFYIGLVAAALTFFNIFISMDLPPDVPVKSEPQPEDTIVERCLMRATQSIADFRKSNYKRYWDVILLKTLISTMGLIFFAKYTQILAINFKSSSIMVGWTGAFQNTLIFMSTFVIPYCQQIEQLDQLNAVQQVLTVLVVSTFVLCCVPIYEIYLLTLIPMVFGRTFALEAVDHIFDSKNDPHLNKLKYSIPVFVGVFVPILFGLFCDIIHYLAVMMFTFLPATIALIIFRNYTLPYELDEIEMKKQN